MLSYNSRRVRPNRPLLLLLIKIRQSRLIAGVIGSVGSSTGHHGALTRPLTGASFTNNRRCLRVIFPQYLLRYVGIVNFSFARTLRSRWRRRGSGFSSVAVRLLGFLLLNQLLQFATSSRFHHSDEKCAISVTGRAFASRKRVTSFTAVELSLMNHESRRMDV